MSALLLLLVGQACRRDEQARPEASAGFGIESPAAGDTLVEGRTYTIRWAAAAGMHVNLGARMGGHDKGHLLLNAPANPDSLFWTVPIGFVTGFGPRSAEVWFRLENADSVAQWVEAGPMLVTGAPPRS